MNIRTKQTLCCASSSRMTASSGSGPSSIRKKVTGFIRQLSNTNNCDENRDPKSPQRGCFIHQYLNGEVKREHPDVLFGKNCQELPVHNIAPLSKDVFAAYTGPKGGLTRVNRSGRHVDICDPEVSFIDEEPLINMEVNKDINRNTKDVDDNVDAFREESTSDKENEESDEQKYLVCDYEIAGIKNWNRLHKNAYGQATTLYECHPITRENAGEPIADTLALIARENSSILALADGVNWGAKACLAARCAVHGCVDYLNKAIFREGANMKTTSDIFVCLLRSFHAAHNLILTENGMLTTLCAAVVCQLKDKNEYVVCTCNVGDSLAYVYSRAYGVREITQGSHDIYSMRDMRDALGALGPVDGQNPELNNLTISMTLVEEGDIVFLTSDGISDNFDPVVGKFALPKKSDDKDLMYEPVSNRRSGTLGSYQENKQTKLFRRLHCNSASDDDLIPPMCLPIVEAYQRHELTLLRMEDLLRNGVTVGDPPCETAQSLCEQLLDFATKLTVAKRRILEDPDLYANRVVKSECTTPTDLKEFTNSEQRHLRKKMGPKLATVPGKLDHASVVAFKVGSQNMARKRYPLSFEKRIKESSNISEKYVNRTSNNVKNSLHVHSTRIDVHLPIQRESSL